MEIRCSASDSTLRFTGNVPRGLTGYDGYSFDVTLHTTALTAAVTVHDIQPPSWSRFFASLAREWEGWQGEKTHESLEYHLRISATMDSVGHVALRVTLRGDVSENNWRAEDTLFLEAGQLERLSRHARNFFG